MRTIKDVYDLVEGYRAKYPWLKAKVTDQTIAGVSELEVMHGISAANELYYIFEREIEIELKAAALVKLGVPWDQAYDAMQKHVPFPF
jgi:hypothetical protein